MRSLLRPSSSLLAVLVAHTISSPPPTTAFAPRPRQPCDAPPARPSSDRRRPRRRLPTTLPPNGSDVRRPPRFVATAAGGLRMMARPYGPGDDARPTAATGVDVDADDAGRDRLKSEFAALLRAVVDETTAEEEYPALIAKNIDTVLKVIGMEEGGALLEEIVEEEAGDRLDEVSEAVDLILSFAEAFVQEARSVDLNYKRLLGNIFQSIAPGDKGGAAKSSSSASMEDRLDELLSHEAASEVYTPGFLRHVEGECARIAGLKTTSPESARMLQILRLIQTRVLEELGKGIGEGAVVLGQLLGYDDEAERMAVLDAGLAVRGVDFARELAALTAEALEGFAVVQSKGEGGVDPELVRSVEAIDGRIRQFVEGSEGDFQ